MNPKVGFIIVVCITLYDLDYSNFGEADSVL